MVDLGGRGVDPRGAAWLVLRRRGALGWWMHMRSGRNPLLLVVVLGVVAVPPAAVAPSVLVHVPVVLPHVPGVAVAVPTVSVSAAALIRILVAVRAAVAAFPGLHLEVVQVLPGARGDGGVLAVELLLRELIHD